MVSFLAGPDGGWVTGQVIAITESPSVQSLNVQSPVGSVTGCAEWLGGV